MILQPPHHLLLREQTKHLPCSPFRIVATDPDRSRPRQVGRQTAMAGGGTYDRIGHAAAGSTLR